MKAMGTFTLQREVGVTVHSMKMIDIFILRREGGLAVHSMVVMACSCCSGSSGFHFKSKPSMGCYAAITISFLAEMAAVTDNFRSSTEIISYSNSQSKSGSVSYPTNIVMSRSTCR